jgi:DNA-binding response OmpR family regulator
MNCPCCGQALQVASAIYYPDMQVIVSPKGATKLGYVQAGIVRSLAQASPGVVTRQHIHHDIYGDRLDPPHEHIINTHLKRLRPKLEEHGLGIETIYGGKLRLREALPIMRVSESEKGISGNG